MHQIFKMASSDTFSPNLEDGFLRPEEAILKIWWKLVFIELISVFWEILDLVYTDMILNRMRNIHALIETSL